jgi:hypothetical protein
LDGVPITRLGKLFSNVLIESANAKTDQGGQIMSGPNQDSDERHAVADQAERSSVKSAPDNSFESLSAGEDPGIVREFVEFLKYNKKWWLTPIVVVTLLLIGAAILLPSPVAPFIYTLF